MSESEQKPWGMEVQAFCTLLHLSQLLSFVIPVLGLLMPLVMWVTQKEQHPLVDQHGKNVANWIISMLIYALACFVLSFIGIGILGFILLGILNIIFIIMGTIKANNGVLWRYPMSLQLIK
ncbi:DUF4870 domain-containing protein [uncultured Ferrimonas sp.]|uniref:DUF4870 domain-containing protein n=1 Tax=uncultured Ferrimonas sp. TaxID=432640 RepID=UPI002632DEF8|nr:DUF4870 domain-containing protein [uncultured Ferrimonas sp.]